MNSSKTLDPKKGQQPEGKQGNGKPNQTPEISKTVVTEKNTVEITPSLSAPVNQRLQRVRELYSLTEKHEKLIETREKLSRFKLSATEIGDKVTLTDTHGNKFETSNTAMIKDVYGLLKTSVDTLITEVESKITF